MNFVYGSWAIPLLLMAGTLCYIIWRQDVKTGQWVKDHWFFERSFYFKLSSIFFFVAIFLLFLSMADLRGPSKYIKSDIPNQKTAILIDVSLSMFAEDVRPSRIEKAVQVAKHFVRKAVGHNISIMIFSDGHKQLVPFTKDIDLLDARLNALKNLDLNRGGSSIKKAVQETMGYFVKGFKDKGSGHGNIVIISDADETFPEFQLNIPDSITVAYLAIGTAKGGRIPIRDKFGNLKGYKKYKGQDVISKIKEDDLKKWDASIKNFYYWILSSYSIPTEDIIFYLKNSHKTKFMEGEGLIRPVLMEYLVVPGLILLALAFLLRLAPQYQIFLFLIISTNVLIAEEDSFRENERKEKTDLDNSLYNKFKEGKADPRERLKIAEQYLKGNQLEKAIEIYKENIKESDISNDRYPEAIVNYGTALMKHGQIKDGIEILNRYKGITANEKIKKTINENIIALLQKQQQRGQGKKKESQGDKNKQDKSSSNQENNEDSRAKPQEMQKPLSNNHPKKNPSKKNQKTNKGRKEELPTILKQLVDKDKKLQEKMLDTKTKMRQSSEQKDW